MNPRRLTLAFAIAALGASAVVALGADAQQPEPSPAPAPAPAPTPLAPGPLASGPLPHPWVPGERFEYTVRLGMFTVGRASLEVLGIDTVRGAASYHVRFAIRGRAIVYQLTDSLESWFGVADLVSRRFHQDGNENGRLYSRHFEILPEQGRWVRNRADTGATVAEPLDEASFFYFARTLPLENGRSYDFPRYFMHDRNPVTIRVLGRQGVSVPAGRFDAIVVRPIFKSRGLFAQGGEATIWFSDDAARVPLRIRSRMSVGTLDLSLRAR